MYFFQNFSTFLKFLTNVLNAFRWVCRNSRECTLTNFLNLCCGPQLKCRLDEKKNRARELQSFSALGSVISTYIFTRSAEILLFPALRRYSTYLFSRSVEFILNSFQPTINRLAFINVKQSRKSVKLFTFRCKILINHIKLRIPGALEDK